MTRVEDGPASFAHRHFQLTAIRLTRLSPTILVCGCSGIQSALSPAGEEAQSIHSLLVATVIGATLIWFALVALIVYAGRTHRRVYSAEAGQKLILWGGTVLPTFLLACLLGYAVWLMPATRPWFQATGGDGLRIEVTGEQFWWRFNYLDASGESLFETANEIRLPVGERVQFLLKSDDVIHSFWVPSLGGKTDMIPGRVTTLSLKATRPGVYRGPCSEFCGTSHALMAVSVVATERPAFRSWMERRAASARMDETPGSAAFARYGCPACHAIRGTEATGRIGPDLTGLGSRQSIGAGTLANTQGNIARFIRDPNAVKPGASMPAFPMIPDSDLGVIAAYLEGLQ